MESCVEQIKTARKGSLTNIAMVMLYEVAICVLAADLLSSLRGHISMPDHSINHLFKYLNNTTQAAFFFFFQRKPKPLSKVFP